MGIIQRQALRNTIVSFVGIAFGSATRLIMPFALESAQIGIVALLDSISGLFVVVFNFGYNLILKKLFPKYRDEENGHAGFLLFGILLTLLGVALASIVYYFTQNLLLSSEGGETDLIKSFAYLIPILIFFRILFLNIDGYVRMLFKTVIGTLLDGLLSKIILLGAIVLIFTHSISFDYFIYLYALTLSLPGLIIVVYAFLKTKKLILPTANLLSERKEISSFVLFGILSGSTSSIIQYADIIMINKLTLENSESLVGIYAIMFFAAMLISIPAKNINRISSVIIAESWKENDVENIQDIYAKSATNLLVIGSYLFIVGWACLDPVLEFLPEYQVGKYVFFFLGLAKIIELGTGVNTEIIETSTKYKYNTYFNLILAVLVIIFNIVLIQMYGIIGAAIASFLAMTIVNILRASLLYKVYDLLPFDKHFFKPLLLVIASILLVSFVDYEADPMVKIAINFSLISLVYWGITIKFGLSPEINDWLAKIKRRFMKNSNQND